MSYVWEQRKLSEFVDKAVDNRGKTPPLDENGTHPLIEVAALGGVHPDYSKIEKYLNDISFENSLRAYIKEGDILFTTVGSIGLVSLMDSREEAAIAQNIVAFRAKENFVPEYLYALFSNGENQYKATRIVMGAVQPSIKVSQLVDVEYMLTSNVKEQKKIGAYFSNLDHLITLHQRKILLYKYFFTIVWEQRKLGDTLVELKSGLSRMLSNNDIGLPVIRANNINEGYLNMETDIKYWYEKDPQGADINNYLVSKGDILINFINSEAKMGTATVVQKVLNRKTIYTTNILKARVDENYDKYFWFTLTLTDKYKNDIKIITKPAVNQASFTTVDFKKLSYLFPNLKEQQKIGNYFSNLDRLITLHRCKCIIYRKNMVNAWEQRKLGDCTFLSGKKNKNNLNLEPYAITNEHGFIPQNKAHDEFGYMKDTDRRAYNIVSKNSFAYNPARINIGSIGYYKGTENVIISSLYEVFQTVDSVYDPFLWQWFKTKDFQNWIIRLQEGSVRLYFYYDKLCECIIRMPKLEEQIKIANYFEALDNLITLHQWKCIVCTKIKVNTWIQCKFIKIGVKLQKCILLSIILLFKRRKVSCAFYVNILLRFIKVIELEVELVFVIIDGTIIVMFYLKIRCLYLNIFIFKINK